MWGWRGVVCRWCARRGVRAAHAAPQLPQPTQPQYAEVLRNLPAGKRIRVDRLLSISDLPPVAQVITDIAKLEIEVTPSEVALLLRESIKTIETAKRTLRPAIHRETMLALRALAPFVVIPRCGPVGSLGALKQEPSLRPLFLSAAAAVPLPREVGAMTKGDHSAMAVYARMRCLLEEGKVDEALSVFRTVPADKKTFDMFLIMLKHTKHPVGRSTLYHEMIQRFWFDICGGEVAEEYFRGMVELSSPVAISTMHQVWERISDEAPLPVASAYLRYAVKPWHINTIWDRHKKDDATGTLRVMLCEALSRLLFLKHSYVRNFVEMQWEEEFDYRLAGVLHPLSQSRPPAREVPTLVTAMKTLLDQHPDRTVLVCGPHILRRFADPEGRRELLAAHPAPIMVIPSSALRHLFLTYPNSHAELVVLMNQGLDGVHFEPLHFREEVLVNDFSREVHLPPLFTMPQGLLGRDGDQVKKELGRRGQMTLRALHVFSNTGAHPVSMKALRQLLADTLAFQAAFFVAEIVRGEQRKVAFFIGKRALRRAVELGVAREEGGGGAPVLPPLEGVEESQLISHSEAKEVMRRVKLQHAKREEGSILPDLEAPAEADHTWYERG